MDKNLRKHKKEESLKPKRFFDELAEYGCLLDFLKARLPDKFENDREFRGEMYEILYNHANDVIPDIEVMYLDKLCETMSYFLEYTKPWRTLKH